MEERAAERYEIMQLSHLYARGLDRFDPLEALSAFSDDAVWDATAVGLDRFEGREKIREFFERDAASVADQFHIITNHIVEFDGPDSAHGTNYVFSEGHAASGAKFRAAALNEDTYVRTASGWRIASRAISPLTPPELEGLDV
ncbi:ketosteroid isomerase-like protein [Prauserella sediminis]|uniref:Ketosteroid isomerase-like protein n=1 Tax=Prauserella sediminis TaxID=577680 RepID=A0A839XPP5_9PSEU|nr:nuclear transport factor 2 family protein [Prauserella sediminis]MBB3665200.1 ketosteroid isomerase-like protein [Prauserella sediminis]